MSVYRYQSIESNCDDAGQNVEIMLQIKKSIATELFQLFDFTKKRLS